MSLLFSSRSLQSAMGRVSKLAIGGAIALTVSGVPMVYAQPGFSEASQSYLEDKQLLENSSLQIASSFSDDSLSDEEKIDLLDAAVVVIDDYEGEYADINKINALRELAQSYRNLGAQTRAVELIDRAAAIARNSELRRYRSPLRMAPAYIEIGEIEAAETLIAQAVAANDYDSALTDHILVAEAYSATGNPELAAATLSLAMDYQERLAAQEDSNLSIHETGRLADIGRLAQTYGQLDDDTAAENGLSRLAALVDAEMEEKGEQLSSHSIYSVVKTLSQLSIAYSLQGNAGEAEAFAAQAMEFVRNDSEVTGYVVKEVATAYGYLENREVAEQALSEMVPLAMSELRSDDLLDPSKFMRVIAIAHVQLGSTAKAEEALSMITSTLDDPHTLVAVLRIYVEMGSASAQEATIQQLFDMLPPLRTAGLDATAIRMRLEPIVVSYIYTADDAQAQARLALLESFSKEVFSHPVGRSAQLARLAQAAASREDYEAAQRLLADATQFLETNGCQEQCVAAINLLVSGYLALEDDQVKQAGFDTLQQIADDRLEPEENGWVSDAILRARATF